MIFNSLLLLAYPRLLQISPVRSRTSDDAIILIIYGGTIMFFESFKQYLDFGIKCDCKMICSIKKANLDEIYELSNYEDQHEADMFRPMTITFLSFDGKGKEISDFVSTGLTAEYITDPRYLQIFLGQIPDWHLVKVDLSPSGASFIHYKFDENGKVYDWHSVMLEIPPYLQFRIDIEGAANIPAESYVITLESSDEHNRHVRFEYDQSGKLQYRGEIKEDEKGTYELITVAR